MTRLLSILLGLASFSGWSATLNSDGSASDVQAKINSASDGDTVTIPAGSFTWASAVTISGKGITLKGAGAHSLVGYSTTSLAVGTGSKTFTTQSGLAITNGQTVRAIYTANGATYMEGTVTSYSGTSLVLNVTATGGSGTIAYWNFRIAGLTIVTATASGTLLTINEDTTHTNYLEGISFLYGSTTGTFLTMNYTASGKPIVVHHCYFSNRPGMDKSVTITSNRGLIHHCSFDSGFYSGTGTTGNDGNNIEAVAWKNPALTTSWSTASTMGTDDTTGLNNHYLEDCYFGGIYLQAFDVDDNARAVIRHCIFNNSAGGTHAQDTSQVGVRHMELYNNTFVFNDMGNYTYNSDYLVYNRGGTGVIASNVMANVTSSAWGDKGELKFTVQNIRRNAGPNPCWTTYPVPHQIGQSHNGSSLYTEPYYVWGTTGGGSGTPVLDDYPSDDCGNGLHTSSFVVQDRDYVLSAKPGWTPYTYPHPLQGTSGGDGGTYYTITASASPVAGGTVTGSGSYASNATVTVSVTATNSGYAWTNWLDWTNIVSTLASFTFTTQSNRTLTAVFGLLPIPPTNVVVRSTAPFTSTAPFRYQ